MPSKYLNKLEGKRILIIGGTSGLGFACAEACLEHGAIVTIASSKPSRIDQALSRLRTAYPNHAANLSGHAVDLASDDAETSLTTLLDFATAHATHKLDHIIETAGEAHAFTSLADATHESIAALSRVRLVGALLIGKLSARYMVVTPDSSITLTGGVMDVRPLPGSTLLAGVAAGKRGVTHGLAVDLKPVRVNLVCPGAVRTELFDGFGEHVEALVEGFRASTLTGRIGRPEELAEVYLSCVKSGFMTGSEIVCDGGYLVNSMSGGV